MTIVEVHSSKHKKDFLAIGTSINSAFPNYVQPLHVHIEEVFDPNKNIQFKYGNASRWILYNQDQKPIGKIAAFYSTKYKNNGTTFNTGGIGFFDCINDQQAANLLFDTAQAWLKQHGLEAMDGPINFGDRDRNWGLLIEGFDKEPIFGMSFNPPYYQALFEGYGFKSYYQQYYYSIDFWAQLPPKFKERFDKFDTKPEYSVKHFSFKELHKYAQDFVTVYNTAWAMHKEGKETHVDEIIKVFNSLKLVLDEKAIVFAYYKEEPIGMFVSIPDLNQYFKHLDGKFGLLQKLKVMWLKYNRHCKKLTGLAFGVVPKFQAIGIDSYMIQYFANILQKQSVYQEYEMGWTGDWNPRMVNIYKSFGSKQSRMLITYRYIFDNKYPFETHPILDYSTK